jgi:hypothetical protein
VSACQAGYTIQETALTAESGAGRSICRTSGEAPECG